ncbi:MAG: ATP-binding protein [Caldisericia bacterium]|nr:ATP-binding protein [Caldisericia bacterium]
MLKVIGKMDIAIASGKGGTGKTTLSVSLTLSLQALTNKKVRLLDCDVEEPNSHLFLSVKSKTIEDGWVESCEFDAEKCTGCNKCVEACRFNAIAIVKKKPIFFSDLCHGCGGCVLACKFDVIKSVNRKIGKIVTKEGNNVILRYGVLNIGEIASPPLIKQVQISDPEIGLTIIDSPPGTSCSMVTSVEKADFVILIAESTAFGLNDLEIAVETVKGLHKSFGVVINRDGAGDDRVEQYCKKESIEILARIPDSLNVAKHYSNGKIAWGIDKEFTSNIDGLATKIIKRFSL